MFRELFTMKDLKSTIIIIILRFHTVQENIVKKRVTYPSYCNLDWCTFSLTWPNFIKQQEQIKNCHLKTELSFKISGTHSNEFRYYVVNFSMLSSVFVVFPLTTALLDYDENHITSRDPVHIIIIYYIYYCKTTDESLFVYALHRSITVKCSNEAENFVLRR